LRIAGVDPERDFGGGETQVMGLTLELIRAGHCAELLCDPAGRLIERAQAAGIQCRPLRVRNSIDVVSGLKLRALLARESYDVVHFHTARAHALAPYARGRADGVIVTRRMDYAPSRLSAFWLYNRAVDRVVAISEGVAAALKSAGVKRDRITIIPSGVDCAHFAPPTASAWQQARAALGLLPADIAIGTVGSLVARKGHRVLVDAMALARDIEVVASAPNAMPGHLRCFIAGAGPLQATLVAQIRRQGLDNCVRMMGARNDPRCLLWALDIFIMPSLNEGLGVAALEAMACGLPVVASAIGGLREVVEHGRTGYLIAPGDVNALAEALRALAHAHQCRTALGAAGRQRAVASFRMEVMAQRTLELYSHTLRMCAEARKG
jgi:glycosyltransferase involved in cell wall biosynthesis